MIRQLKSRPRHRRERDRSSAMITMKAMLIHGSDQPAPGRTARKRRCSPATSPRSRRPGSETPDDSVRHTLSASSRAAGSLSTRRSPSLRR
jgi:hypothetical protein